MRQLDLPYLQRGDTDGSARDTHPRQPASVVDHVIPMSMGGPHNLENCKTAHWTCNAQKHKSLDFSLARELDADNQSASTRDVATAVLPNGPLRRPQRGERHRPHDGPVPHREG
jgi:hypothetical protein